MTCRDCAHFLPSIEANKTRWGLAGYGYCNTAPDILARCLFFHEGRTCWQKPIAFKERSTS